MIRIAALDDNANDLQYIKILVETYFREKEEPFQIEIYERSMDLLFDLDQGKYYDLYFLDVEMPVRSGIEVAREIRKYYLEPVIVYITDYVEYSIEAYEVNAFRYIPKKMIDVKLGEALDAIIPKLYSEKQKSYIITHYLDMEVIYHKEIYYLEKEGKYVRIYHKRGESRVRKTLQDVIGELDAEEFLEIGKSFAVNVRHVMAIEKQEVVLRNGVRIPVSRRRVDALKEGIVDYWTGRV